MQTIGEFELKRRLGSGAFATVWLARDPHLDTHVAIKVLGDNWVGQPDIVRRFIDEARLLRQLDDPRVIDVYTLGELDTGQPWFAMAYADRGTLEDRLASASPESNPLSLDEALGLVTAMGHCVVAIHRLGAVHRDVKPGNFLIRSTLAESTPVPGLAPDERLLIGDLGLAKVLANSSGFTVAAGSPMYMAPEQASMSADVTFAADVFSLAICAWEVLTGSPPPRTGGLTGAGEFEAHLLPAASTVRGDIPPHIDAALARATARVPAERWPSVEDFITALTAAPSLAPAVSVGDPPHKEAPTLAEPAGAARVPPRSKRLPLAVGAVLVVVAAIVVAVVLASQRSNTIAGAPDWFEPPSEATGLSSSRDGNNTSVVAVLPGDFADACETFLTQAAGASWQIVRNDCATDELLGSVRNGSETAVIARLANDRVGWQFERP